MSYAEDLRTRQARALAAKTKVAKERIENSTEEEGPSTGWAQLMGIEMMLVVHCMKTEYQAAGRVGVRHFMQETGLNEDYIEREALRLLAAEAE